jgi:hypothetical protein
MLNRNPAIAHPPCPNAMRMIVLDGYNLDYEKQIFERLPAATSIGQQRKSKKTGRRVRPHWNDRSYFWNRLIRLHWSDHRSDLGNIR